MNFAKALLNPLVLAPRLNNFPVLTIGPGLDVLADGAVALGGCVIDVEHGVIDLSLEAQLDSIRRLFSDDRQAA